MLTTTSTGPIKLAADAAQDYIGRTLLHKDGAAKPHLVVWSDACFIPLMVVDAVNISENEITVSCVVIVPCKG